MRQRAQATKRNITRLLCAAACVFWCPASTGGAQLHAVQQTPTADEIATLLHQHNQERNAALLKYTSRRTMTLDYSNFLGDRSASEQVEMLYTAPGTKSFTVLSSTGPLLLRDGVFQREMDNEKAAATPDQREAAALTPDHYILHLQGVEHLPEGECYVLNVAPRGNNRFGFTGRVWVQSTDFAVVRIEAVPQESPSLLINGGTFTATFAKVGDFWLPRETVSKSHVRLGGHAIFTMEFGPYRILEAHPVIFAGEHP